MQFRPVLLSRHELQLGVHAHLRDSASVSLYMSRHLDCTVHQAYRTTAALDAVKATQTATIAFSRAEPASQSVCSMI